MNIDEKTVITPTELQQRIIEYSQDKCISLLEACIAIADERGLDLEDLARYITGSLKEMMQVQLEDCGMLKRESNSHFEL